MKSIIVIHLYFGRLPSFFELWLRSCEMNSTIDFLICTDQKVDSNAANIKVFTTNLLEIKKRIEELIKFKVCLSSPRKLCDYKGLYDLIFQEYTKNYDFWGFCDSDLIFGNIRTFLTDDILNNYDHILGLGHFQLQRTSDTKYFDVIKQSHGMGKNPYWLNKFSIEGFVLDTGLDWKSVFTTEKNQVFDELPYGVAAKYYELYPNLFWSGHNENNRCFDDVDSRYCYFSDIYNTYSKYCDSGYLLLSKIFPLWKREKPSNPDLNAVIYRKKGKHLFRIGKGYNGKLIEQELLYVHFLHRKMKVKTNDYVSFLIVPNRFINDRKFNLFLFFFYAFRIEHKWNIYIAKLQHFLGRIKEKYYE